MIKDPIINTDIGLRNIRKEIHNGRFVDAIELMYEEIVKVKLNNTILQSKVALLEDFIKSRDILLHEKMNDDKVSTDYSLPSQVKIDATWNLGSENSLHQLEYDQAGRSYRWSGPDNQFGFDVLLDRSSVKSAIIELIYEVDALNFSGISAFVDGQPIPIKKEVNDGSMYGVFDIEERMWAGLTFLRFHVPVQKSPSADDKRLIGVAFHRLTIR